MGHPVGYQRWRNLLFVHWPVSRETLRPLVPDALELDVVDGQAYVTLIPFLVEESRPIGVPRWLASRFLEVNLRTYVRASDGEAGIYFFSLEASSALAVAAARLLYGLPYFLATMSMRTGDTRIEYVSRRRDARDARLEIAWSVEESIGTAVTGTRDHFLIERYKLYVMRRGRLYRGRVRHRPYPLHGATIERLSETLCGAAGLPSARGARLCHFSPGVDVEIFWLQRVS